MDSELMMFLSTIFFGAIRISIPIAFGAIACTICEKSGIVNIGIEGMMLAGAFGGVLGSYLFNNPWIGLIFAMLGGVSLAIIHGLLTIKYNTEHIISGLGINLLSSGLTTVLLVVFWNNRGKSDAVASFQPIEIPGLGSISPLLIILIIIVILSWIFLNKTVIGLRIKFIGENPYTADSVGIKVNHYKWLAVLLCGAIAGIGGAYLSIGDIGLFSREMVAGRGYVAMALTILGNWNPLFVFGGSLLFGLAQSIQFKLQAIAPVQLIQMLPYLLTILVLIIAKKKGAGPAAAGKAFIRE